MSYGVLKEHGIDTPDLAAFIGTTAKGTIVTLESCWTMPDGFAPQIDFPIEIIGEKGAAHVDLFPHDLTVHTTRSTAIDHSLGVTDYADHVSGWWMNSV